MPRGLGAPLRDRRSDLCRNIAGFVRIQFEIPKYPATSIASAREAVLSSSLIAVLRMRGLMPVGTGLRS
jgi:hypothetical protein